MIRRLLKLIFITSLVLCICLLSVFDVFAEEPSVSTSALYDEMLGFFVIGDRSNSFDDAIEIYENNAQLKTYADAEKYYRYMCARKLLIEEEWENSSLLFHSLDAFRDSKLYYAYVNGRIAENESRFEDAVTFYIEASDLPALDCVTRMQNCDAKISDEKKSKQYQEAVNDYEMAISTSDQAKVDEVKKVFLSLGDYQKSKDYVSLCENWLKTQNREISLSLETNGSTLIISWQDNEDGHSYMLQFKPENCEKYETIDECTSPLTITDCIPGTTYEIVIADNQDKQVNAIKTVSIPQAEKYTTAELKLLRMDIAGIQKNEIVLSTLSPVEVFNDYPEFMLWQEDGTYTDQQLSGYKLYANIIYSNTTSEEKDIDLYTVIRSSSAGTYKSDIETLHLPADSAPRMVCSNIDILLDIIRKETGLLPVGQYLVEAYIQGQMFCAQTFIVK